MDSLRCQLTQKYYSNKNFIKEKRIERNLRKLLVVAVKFSFVQTIRNFKLGTVTDSVSLKIKS